MNSRAGVATFSARQLSQVLGSARASISTEAIKVRWQKMDPVDMEEVERDHFQRTGQVLKMSHVQARPTLGNIEARLSQIQGMKFLEGLERASTSDVVVMLESMLTAPKNEIFHRDLKHDGQFLICKKLLGLTVEEIGENILSICMALNKFEPEMEIPNRVWRRQIVAAVRAGKAKTDNVPPGELQSWNPASRWCRLAAEILMSGRVKATHRLLSYLVPPLVESEELVQPRAVQLLLDGFVKAGAVSVPVLDKWSNSEAQLDQFSVGLLAELILARVHFGLGNESSLVDRFVTRVEEGLGLEIESMPIAQQLMIVRCLQLCGTDLPESLLALTSSVCGRIPDLDESVFDKNFI